jgi:hypothetical protein
VGYGGTSIKNQLHQNQALGENYFWKIHHEPHFEWVRILREIYLANLNREKALRIVKFPKGS